MAVSLDNALGGLGCPQERGEESGQQNKLQPNLGQKVISYMVQVNGGTESMEGWTETAKAL